MELHRIIDALENKYKDGFCFGKRDCYSFVADYASFLGKSMCVKIYISELEAIKILNFENRAYDKHLFEKLEGCGATITNDLIDKSKEGQIVFLPTEHKYFNVVPTILFRGQLLGLGKNGIESITHKIDYTKEYLHAYF